MKAFAYVNPANEKEAVAALKVDGIALPIAGGQDLLARMKDYIDSPDRLVNVKGLDATVTSTPDGGLQIGVGGEDRGPRGARAGHEALSGGRRTRRAKSARRRFGIRARSAATSTSGRAAGTSATRSSSASRRAASAASR